MTSLADDPTVLQTLEGSDRFLIQQVFRPIANEYRISVPPPGSTDEGEPILFVKQKKLKIKEDIRFRTHAERDEHLFMIKAKTVFEFRGRHDVLAGDGQQIGLLHKDFARSLIRSHWHVLDAGETELFEGYEASWPVAVARRLGNFLPEGLSLLTWLPFNVVLMRNGERVGHYRRVLGKLRDRYLLELEPGLEGLDRRLVLAFAVALDALQDR